MYLHVFYKRMSYFYKKTIRIFLLKYGQNLMKGHISKIHVSKGLFMMMFGFGLEYIII